MAKIKHLFFDLDRTLWDFEKNSHEELVSIYQENQLHQKGISLKEEFIKVYKNINNECWELYRNNLMTKEVLRTERFKRTLEFFGLHDHKLSEKIGNQYVENSPKRTLLIDGALDLLNYLKEKYQMHIITNGFEEVQFLKLSNSGLAGFFNVVITSEAAGYKKPHPIIFEYALNKAKAKANESIMIGDDLQADIKGGLSAGMGCIYFNPHDVQHELKLFADIKQLNAIKMLL